MELRIASEFSEVPMTAWINQAGCHIPIVACYNWIMPRDCFIQLWFWCMADGRIYSKLWDHVSWSQVLQDLNTHNQIPHHYKEKVLEWIYQKVYVKMNSWDLEFKRMQFERVLEELSETTPM
jgi:uncharacterized membrane protein YbaN (DUF454 family)